MHLRLAVAAMWLALAGTALPDDGAPIGRATPALERVAVLPFRGAPEFRRPCEEAVALALRRASGLVVVTPFEVTRALARASQAGREEKPPSFDAEASAPSPEEARELARWLDVDALVSGSAARAPLGAPEVVVVLFARSSGKLLAQRREGGGSASLWPSDDPAGEAAAAATRAADAILEVLGRPAPPRKPSLEPTSRPER